MEHILETKQLSVSFGEHHVIQKVNFNVPKGKFISIIGPNGAGKTTLFNLLSGQIPPTEGEIHFKNNNITKLSIAERTRLGMGRSFQQTNIFPELTVLENVRMAVQSTAKDLYSLFPMPAKLRAQQEEAKKLLETVFLQDKSEFLAANLAHGEKRKLEIAMLLALKPELLLLDEPTAGISVEEVPAILKVIENIKSDDKNTIVLIEHKMEMVLHLSDYLVVLFNGELLAEGEPEKIMDDERVQSAYLGGFFHADSK
ncbi:MULTISPECIES: ABC transporter ATP-binding protein [Sutcliffiella]|uniref:ABC transporter ATP-binding protein n=1 Tax=Sutcliffiella cohnii TaxID=33932 RepID=A0A223KN10_9BACI|nr:MULTISPECIES: ABC transporter ATP-binding protein [Sutcliffiella]AST90895.1 ABC transporter ATP-binding protein [Sutcliffiella cohnii]WBL16682.1 ABC transporter ATP-binding protein [Sutcliffiella sp. NC1]